MFSKKFQGWWVREKGGYWTIYCGCWFLNVYYATKHDTSFYSNISDTW